MSRKSKKRQTRHIKIKLHAGNQKHHTLIRFHERFGMDLSEHEYRNLIRQIQTGKSLFIESLSPRVKNHLVQCRDKVFTVGYDKRTKQIRTVLPAKRLEEVYA